MVHISRTAVYLSLVVVVLAAVAVGSALFADAKGSPKVTNRVYFDIEIDGEPAGRITFGLDGKHVVFGRVLDGMDIVKRVEALGSQSGTPSKNVVISDSGELPAEPEEATS